MKIKQGQYESTLYSDQHYIRIGVDPIARCLEWLMLVLFIVFLVVAGWAGWIIWTL